MKSINAWVLAVLLPLSGLAAAEGADYIKFRKVNGTGFYATFDQNATEHTITIHADGQTGSYCVKGSNTCGKLYNIEFDEDSDVRGQWVMNGTRGTFQWDFNGSETEFTGGFRMARRGEGVKYIPFDGFWDGKFD